jgi:heme-degrading monooxygenase HmoA
VLGYEYRGDSPDEDLIDPRGRGASFWFQQMDAPQRNRHRFRPDPTRKGRSPTMRSFLRRRKPTDAVPAPATHGGQVIVRSWHATATAEGAAAYREHFTDSVLPELQRIDGHQGAYLLRRDHDGQVELQVLTLWDSLEAIRGFAGSSPNRAVVEPVAQAALATYDTTVTHHTVVVDTVGANARTDR